MYIVISNASDDPIYQQIADQVRSAIVNRTLAPGEMLPSIRTLARELQVSVITTKRAYAELEHEGLIDSVAGKGSYVAEQNPEFLREKQVRAVENLLEEAVSAAKAYGIPQEHLTATIDILYGEEE